MDAADESSPSSNLLEKILGIVVITLPFLFFVPLKTILSAAFAGVLFYKAVHDTAPAAATGSGIAAALGVIYYLHFKATRDENEQFTPDSVTEHPTNTKNGWNNLIKNLDEVEADDIDNFAKGRMTHVVNSVDNFDPNRTTATQKLGAIRMPSSMMDSNNFRIPSSMMDSITEDKTNDQVE